MGVIRFNEGARPIRVEEINYGDYIFDDDETDNELEELERQAARLAISAPPTPRRRRQRMQIQYSKTERKVQRFLDMDALNGGMKVKRRMGARKMRRLENARLMYALADPDDICDDFSDMLPSEMSAFAKLFVEQSNMKAWNDFIEKDEEEQRAFLEGEEEREIDEFGIAGHRVGGRRERGRTCSESPLKAASPNDRGDEARRHHPAYSAAACFSRLDPRFKSLFSQKRLPWEFISDSENSLRSFFLKSDSGGVDSAWSSPPIPSSLHRLIVHGLSQYLALQSSSELNGSMEKCVKVVNSRAFFIPPHKTLVAFISQSQKCQRKFLKERC